MLPPCPEIQNWDIPHTQSLLPRGTEFLSPELRTQNHPHPAQNWGLETGVSMANIKLGRHSPKPNLGYTCLPCSAPKLGCGTKAFSNLEP